MITRNESIQNNKCTITYNYWCEGVIINSVDFACQRIFGGYPGLLERYRELAESFSEEISFQDACNYFTLTPKEHEAYQPK